MRTPRSRRAVDELGTLYELDGAVRYRVIAYREAARVIRDSPVSVEELAREGRATELPGVGKTLRGEDRGPPRHGARSRRPTSSSSGSQRRSSRSRWSPASGREDGPPAARRARDLRPRAAPGGGRGRAPARAWGPGTEGRAERARGPVDRLEREGAERRLLSHVLPVAEELAAALREHQAAADVVVAGSARRMDRDLQGHRPDRLDHRPEALGAALAADPLAAPAGGRRRRGRADRDPHGITVDLRIAEPEDFGNLLQHFTGSAEHNVELRERAVKVGLSVSEHGITDVESGEVTLCATEEEVYERLGLAYIEPELREGGGEIKAAGDGELPDLVTLEDIRGDLHCHTTLSDGRNTLEEMAEAAREPRLRLPRGHRPLGDATASATTSSPTTLLERIEEVRS